MQPSHASSDASASSSGPSAPSPSPAASPAPGFTSSRLTVEGTTVYIDSPVVGAGPEASTPVLLMIHGWPDTHQLWEPQVAHFRSRFRCVRFTLPGYADDAGPRPGSLDAMTARIAAIANAVSPQAPVHLLLHDWGCFFGYEFAMQHPERVSRVIAVDVGDAASPEFMRSRSAKDMAFIMAYQGWLALAYAMPRFLGDPMTRSLARLMHVPNAEGASARMNYPYADVWTGRYRRARPPQLPMPLLYVYGSRKPVMFQSQAWLDRLNATPGSAAYALPTGHWVMRQQPVLFHHLIDAWLAGSPVAPSAVGAV